jgi:UMF1 family MFS transporter
MTHRRNAADRSWIGWMMYDWANSAFVLCVVSVIGAQYFIYVFEQAAQTAGGLRVGPAVAMNILGAVLPGEAVWSFLMSAAAFIVVITSPFLGTLADGWHVKKQFLRFYCLFGALATLLLVSPQPWWIVGALILAGTVGFEGGNVYYNAFLPEIADVEGQDRLSSWGFAAGYIGGVIVLIASLILFTPVLLNPPAGSIRYSFLLVALWWGGFGMLACALMRERAAGPRKGGLRWAATQSWRELIGTVRNLTRYPQTMKFLLAFLLYNDGIATLISNVTPYALQNIYLDRTLTEKIGTSQLIFAIIIVQLVAFPGSLFFGWLAGKIGQKGTIYLCIGVFIAAVTYGQVARIVTEFYLMAALVGWVLGGSQAISRALFAGFVPEGKSAEFFSFFALSDRVSAMGGPLVYGLLLWLTGNTRIALLSLTVFFLAGGLVLTLVNVEKGRQQARAG